MNLRSIIYNKVTIGCSFLLIFLLLIWYFGGNAIFWGNLVMYNAETQGIIWVRTPKLEYICTLVSLPFLLLTLVIYSILPELQNMHGYTLRVHVASLFVTNVIKFCLSEFPKTLSAINNCLTTAYIFNFSSFSSLFWLNVICFDTWWTLRQLRLYQANLKKREKKVFIMYSIYAWGVSFILNVVYAILDIPSISKYVGTPPNLCVNQFSFDLKGLVYFYVPVSASVIVNICFFIALTRKIWNHGKQTASQLRNARISNDNKNKGTIYVTLSAVLGISWIMKMILWSSGSFVFMMETDRYYWKFVLWHIAEIIDIFQGVILFFAFVYKKKIMLLLLKRFGWQDVGWRDFVNILRNNNRPSTNSNAVTLTSVSPILSTQEVSLSNQQSNHRVESCS